MQRCVTHEAIEVRGSGKKPYIVSFTDPTQPTCTCTAFAIGRNRMKARMEGRPVQENSSVQTAWCKHIDQLYNKVCRWSGEPLIEGLYLCPECGSKTVEVEDV